MTNDKCPKCGYSKLNIFDRAQPGMLIKHKNSREGTFVILANFGKRITAVRLADITNTDEWLLYDAETREWE